jgi:hypothetical protein
VAPSPGLEVGNAASPGESSSVPITEESIAASALDDSQSIPMEHSISTPPPEAMATPDMSGGNDCGEVVSEGQAIVEQVSEIQQNGVNPQLFQVHVNVSANPT